MKNSYPKRGEVFWISLDPSNGKEIKKTRPCLVVSSNIANQSELIVVAPITSNVNRVFPRIEVQIYLEGKLCKVIPRQLRCIDIASRLGKKIGSISIQEMQQVDDAIRLILGL